MKRRQNALRCQMELVGVLTRQIPTRLIEISRSGCLLESGHRIEEGTVAALRLEIEGQSYLEDVRATRCVVDCGLRVELSRGRGVPADGKARRIVDSAGARRVRLAISLGSADLSVNVSRWFIRTVSHS